MTEQRLLDQKRVIVTKQLLSSLELEHIQCSVRSDSRDVPVCSSPSSDVEHPVTVLDDSISAVDTTSLVSNLSLEEELLLSEINVAVVEFSDFQNRPRLRRLDFRLINKVKPLLAMVNNFIQRLPTNSLSETNTLVFAIAYVLTSRVTSPISSNHSRNSPPWKVRLQSKVKLTRK